MITIAFGVLIVRDGFIGYICSQIDEIIAQIAETDKYLLQFLWRFGNTGINFCSTSQWITLTCHSSHIGPL
jgi:hypothetical protein